MDKDKPILKVENLVTQFHTPEGIIHAVNGVSFHLNKGETIAVVGESGCGKSVTMLSILGLIPQPPAEIMSGTACFMGKDLLKISNEALRSIRGRKIGMVFQDPMTSLNPVLKIERQLIEPMMEHKHISRQEAFDKAVDLLNQVGIPEPRKRIKQYPHQFSGGMRQRVMIAIALSCSPDIIIADEPTTALDVTIQAQIVDLVQNLQDDVGASIVWITHDLGVVAGLAQRVIVMYAGGVIEEAVVDEIYNQPIHPYTIGLLNCLPRLDREEKSKLYSISGNPPVLYDEPKSCPFMNRCQFKHDRCNVKPPLIAVNENHKVACWLADAR
ncbi:MAG: ABC transporter ATP-binding protein [Anaerolineaceae bacterium]|jgi:oligopeptide transport system ATP-binding protein|nr:ABC transporter ATP-binding protein [Anaerolineaceae bacterium]